MCGWEEHRDGSRGRGNASGLSGERKTNRRRTIIYQPIARMLFICCLISKKSESCPWLEGRN